MPQRNNGEGIVLPNRLACVTVPNMQDDCDPQVCFMDQFMRLLLPAEDRVPLVVDGGR